MNAVEWAYRSIALDEKEREIYARKIKPFLPSKIVDFHTHICLTEHVRKTPLSSFDKKAYSYYENYLGWLYPLTVEKLRETNKKIYEDKEVASLCLPVPLCLLDANAMNCYIKESAEKYHDIVGLAAPTHHSVEELDALIEQGGFKGFKTFTDLPDKRYGDDSINVSDFVRPEMMMVANRRRLIVLIHLPKSRRIADPKNIKEISEIATKYPEANILIAHMGRSFCPSILEAGLKGLGKLENVYLDTSSVTEETVFEVGLNELGSDKLVFGTDAPLSFLRARRPCVKAKIRVQKSGMSSWYVKDDVPWVTPEERKTYANELSGIILYAYEQILGIKRTIEKLGLGRNDVEKIFRKNAEHLLSKTES